MATKKINKTTEKILKGLYSSEHAEVIKALELIPAKGNDHVVIPLIDLYLKSGSSEVKEKISKIILQLRSESCIDILLGALNEPKNLPIQHFIISAFWNNNWDMGDYISILAQFALSGSFETALEVLTVIENQEGPFDDEQLMDAIVSSREYLSKNKIEPKKKLILSLIRVLEDFDHNQ